MIFVVNSRAFSIGFDANTRKNTWEMQKNIYRIRVKLAVICRFFDISGWCTAVFQVIELSLVMNTFVLYFISFRKNYLFFNFFFQKSLIWHPNRFHDIIPFQFPLIHLIEPSFLTEYVWVHPMSRVQQSRFSWWVRFCWANCMFIEKRQMTYTRYVSSMFWIENNMHTNILASFDKWQMTQLKDFSSKIQKVHIVFFWKKTNK